MSFYLAHPADANTEQTVSKSVLDRGLSLLKAKPADVQVSVLVMYNQPAYTNYVRDLPAFISATLQNRTVPIGSAGHPIGDVPHLLPWRLPRLIYSFPTKPNDSKVEALKDHSVVIQGRNKNISFVMEHPTNARIRALVDDGIESKTPHIFGTVNLDAMKAVFILRKILSAFILTHVYPAFRHSSDINYLPRETVVISKKRKVSDTAFVRCISNPAEHIDDPDDDAVVEPYDDTQPGRTIQLKYATPSPITNDKWGDLGHIPNASGLYVPYIEDLAIGDRNTVPELVSSYFLKCLASDARGIVGQMNKLRSAWGIIAVTSLGKEISHLAKCIDIALKAQAIVYPVYTDTILEGCLISGAGYSVNVRDQVYEPIGYADLQVLVRDSSMHSRSIAEIKLQVPIHLHTRIDDCTSIREMSNMLKGAQLDDTHRKTIMEAATHLAYKNTYWSTSAANIKTMMALLLSPDDAVNPDIPMHPRYMFYPSRYEEVLSAFGHMAPTFMIPNGTQTRLDGGSPPKNFNVRTATIDIAIGDMKFIAENGYITNNTQNRSAKHRDAPIHGSDKVEIWTSLNNFYAVQRGGVPVAGQPAAMVVDAGDDISDGLFD